MERRARVRLGSRLIRLVSILKTCLIDNAAVCFWLPMDLMCGSERKW